MNPRKLPKVEMPDDLTIDELKRIDVDEVSALVNKLRRSVIGSGGSHENR